MKKNATLEITDLKVIKWWDSKEDKIFYGIDGKVGGIWYHLLDDDKPMFFDRIKDARDKKNEMEKESIERRGVAVIRKKEPKGRTINFSI